ncbi:hypothetical protein Goklo_026523 [Gossypium klotzschianum]|uniref:DUF4283 domain-containing protein n=1 Tax=Gossypium klotzschianum TaxID=34286 RepID=A0A7J8TV94_9ROSI|nr:hypothetical protein [Gossypium klotzschianum]
MEEALADLRLTEEGDSREMEAWEIEKEVVAGEPLSELCLVGCFLTATTINFQSMRTVMANLWHPLGGISIMEVGEKRFVFQFYCEIDFDRVVKGAPWTFNNHLLVFHHLKQGEGPLEFGDFIRTFVDYDVKAIAAGLRNYMWIRVKIDIRRSLKRKKKLIVAKKERKEGASSRMGYLVEISATTDDDRKQYLVKGFNRILGKKSGNF